MIDVLKILAGKVNGAPAVLMTAMILIYMLGIAVQVNNMILCVSLITFLAVLFMVAKFFKGKTKKDNNG